MDSDALDDDFDQRAIHGAIIPLPDTGAMKLAARPGGVLRLRSGLADGEDLPEAPGDALPDGLASGLRAIFIRLLPSIQKSVALAPPAPTRTNMPFSAAK